MVEIYKVYFKVYCTDADGSVFSEIKTATFKSFNVDSYLNVANGFWLSSDFEVVYDLNRKRHYWIPPSNILGIEKNLSDE